MTTPFIAKIVCEDPGGEKKTFDVKVGPKPADLSESGFKDRIKQNFRQYLDRPTHPIKGLDFLDIVQVELIADTTPKQDA